MASPQVGERVRHLGEQFEPLAAQRRDFGAQEGAQSIERLAYSDVLAQHLQRRAEVQRSIAMGAGALTLDGEQGFTRAFGAHPVLGQPRGGAIDHRVEVDVVLPQCVVGIDEQRQAWCAGHRPAAGAVHEVMAYTAMLTASLVLSSRRKRLFFQS